ncbi:TPA: restriction endonuclease subunit S [Photobacterium damselae]
MVPKCFTPLNDFVSKDAPICYGILKPGNHISDGVPVVKVKNIHGGKVDIDGLLKTSHEIHKQYKRAELATGDVLLTIRGTTGRVAIAPPELNGANITQDTARIRVSTDDCTTYIFYALQAPQTQWQIELNTVGQAVKGINIAEVKKLNIYHPPQQEQRKIAQILSTWDRGIATTEKLIDASKQQKKALMQQLLTGKKRLINPETGKAFQGEWENTTFQSSGIKVTDGDRGKEYPKSNEFHSSEYCLFLSAQNVTKNGFKFETTQFIDEIKHNKLRKGIVNLGDLVLTTRGSVGHFAFFDKNVPYRIIRINSGMVTLTPNNQTVDSNYLYCLCRSNIIKNQIDIAAFGSAQPQLTIGIINKLKFKLPLLVEQQKIASVLTAADKEIELLEAKLAHFKQEKKALMQQLLTGKRRVNIAETKVATEETLEVEVA